MLVKPPMSHTWPQDRHVLVDISDQDPPWSTMNIRRRAPVMRRRRDSSEVERHSQPSTSQASWHDTFSQSSEATSPLISDTALFHRRNPIQENELSYPTQRTKSQLSRNSQLEDAVLEGLTYLCESEHFSIAEHNEGSYDDIRSHGASALSDTSTPNYFTYTEPVEYLDPGGSDRPQNFRRLSKPTPSPQVTQPRSLHSNVASHLNPEAESDSLIVSCDLCNLRFTGRYRKGNLARHKRLKHHEMARYLACSQCSRSFARSDALLKHIRKHHPSLSPDEPKSRSYTCLEWERNRSN